MPRKTTRNPPLFFRGLEYLGDDIHAMTDITLRDLFAGLVAGSLAGAATAPDWRDVAHDAYNIADAMLAAREDSDAQG